MKLIERRQFAMAQIRRVFPCPRQRLKDGVFQPRPRVVTRNIYLNTHPDSPFASLFMPYIRLPPIIRSAPGIVTASSHGLGGGLGKLRRSVEALSAMESAQHLHGLPGLGYLRLAVNNA